MKPGDTIVVHTYTTGNYRGTLHSYDTKSYILTQVLTHRGTKVDKVVVYIPDIKLIKVN